MGLGLGLGLGLANPNPNPNPNQDHALEELSVVDAFAATAAANLTRHAVESTAVDVPGAEGALYMQRYHTAHVSGEGEPDGHGSFRCLMTKASRAQSD